MPVSAAAGFNERVTLRPEWRPIPAQGAVRRSVRCDAIRKSGLRGRQRLSKRAANISTSSHEVDKSFIYLHLAPYQTCHRLSIVTACGQITTESFPHDVSEKPHASGNCRL